MHQDDAVARDAQVGVRCGPADHLVAMVPQPRDVCGGAVGDWRGKLEWQRTGGCGGALDWLTLAGLGQTGTYQTRMDAAPVAALPRRRDPAIRAFPPVAAWSNVRTLGAKGGIRPASRFEMELDDPVLKRRMTHAYDIISLPVIT